MPIIEGQDEIIHLFDLANPQIGLDLTSDKWYLRPGQASMVLGRDVLRTGRFAPEGGRKPLGSSVPSADRPVSDAWGSAFSSAMGVRFSGVYQTTAVTTGQYTGSTTSLQKKFAPYAWPAEMVGAYIVQNGDRRVGETKIRRIASISTTAQTDDTLNWTLAMSGGFGIMDKFYIIYSKQYDKRGIWLTNGRKFWLLQGGSASLYLDLGSDDYLGERWDCARISNHLIMFVNPKYPARIVQLNRAVETGTSDDETIAGLLAPVKPINVETTAEADGNVDKSWWMEHDIVGGDLSNGEYQALVRAVNYDDGAESRFARVFSLDGADAKHGFAVVANKRFSPHENEDDVANSPCPVHRRWTHFEVWRTIADGSDYYLEQACEISDLPNEDVESNPSFDFPDLLMKHEPDNQYACSISDAALVSLPQLSATDSLAGFPPPICRKVLSLQGVTLCAGKADEDAADPTFYNINFVTDPSHGSNSYSHDTLSMNLQFLYTNYTWVDGDVLEIRASTEGVTGSYDIASKINADNIELDSPGPGEDLTNVYCYIRRPYTIPWPTIVSDEQIHYSRTDKFAPESFLARTLTLSYIGDTFRTMVGVGNYAAVVMAQGVHLLFLDSGELLRDTIAQLARVVPSPRPNGPIGFERDAVGIAGRYEGYTSKSRDEYRHRARHCCAVA